MTDPEVFPIIAPNDYPAFRRLVGADMPDTYDEWDKLQRKEIREYVQAGRSTETLEVYTDEFTRFLRSRGANANLVNLRNFTIEKHAGNSY